MNVAAMRVPAGSVLLALLVSLALVAVDARPAFACSCAGGESTEEAFLRATAVFSGGVVEIGDLPTEQWDPTGPDLPLLAPVNFHVKGAWKSVGEGPVVVHGQGPAPSCGLDFERGETYLVFAGSSGSGEDGPLQTGLCSATRLTSLKTARNMLGPPTATLPPTGGVSPEDLGRELGPTLVAATAILASLVAGVAFVGRAVRGPGR